MERNIDAPCIRRPCPYAGYATKWDTAAQPAHGREREPSTSVARKTQLQATPAWPNVRFAEAVTSQVPKDGRNASLRLTSSGNESGRSRMSNRHCQRICPGETRPGAVEQAGRQRRRRGEKHIQIHYKGPK
ncbi:hypothetical protein HPB49_009743 [Dermacentor silvarum]|uniref:Uncharacterized protein n=1 Tax=Dermacentor silvarum TaxID=543639 RepID=A0ACB8DNY8_DERSI|nr:hypothetical protein HPB49_009743 [Dermacentor silvarum]